VIEMAEATTARDREAVFRFWYSVYVEEMGRYGSVADHANRQLRDSEDDHSRILFARDGGEVVASYRLCWGGDGFSERQVRQYSLEPFLQEIPHEWLIIGERTMVAASHRGGSVWADLAMLAGPIAEELGAIVSFGACEPHLVPYYAKFNNQPYAMRQFSSEESGYLIPIVSVMHVERFGDDPPPCIKRILRGESSARNGEVVGLGAYGAELQSALAPLAREPSVLSGLNDDEVVRACVHSSLITCAAGDQILRRGGTARNPFMVISGALDASADGYAFRLRPGDLFGESGWLADDDRQADVFVIQDGSRILALSLGTLRKLGDTHPALALKIAANAAGILWARLRDAGRLAG
jgi:CRP-like cAMP-binding protein